VSVAVGIQPLEAPPSAVKESPPKQPPPAVTKVPIKPVKQVPKPEIIVEKSKPLPKPTDVKTTRPPLQTRAKPKPSAPPIITTATQGVASSQTTAKKPNDKPHPSVTKNRTPVAPPPREDTVKPTKRSQK